MPQSTSSPTLDADLRGADAESFALPDWVEATPTLAPTSTVHIGRFDVPAETPNSRVLYAGARRACFFETLDKFKTDRLRGISAEGITQDWVDRHFIGEFSLSDTPTPLKWLDTTKPETLSFLDQEFRDVLERKNVVSFDVSVITSQDIEVTQPIGVWARANGYSGIKYVCRHHAALMCWAVFEGTPLTIIDTGSSIKLEDPDLTYVANTWSLRLPTR